MLSILSRWICHCVNQHQYPINYGIYLATEGTESKWIQEGAWASLANVVCAATDQTRGDRRRRNVTRRRVMVVSTAAFRLRSFVQEKNAGAVDDVRLYTAYVQNFLYLRHSYHVVVGRPPYLPAHTHNTHTHTSKIMSFYILTIRLFDRRSNDRQDHHCDLDRRNLQLDRIISNKKKKKVKIEEMGSVYILGWCGDPSARWIGSRSKRRWLMDSPDRTCYARFSASRRETGRLWRMAMSEVAPAKVAPVNPPSTKMLRERERWGRKRESIIENERNERSTWSRIKAKTDFTKWNNFLPTHG